ncbi:hypothetical protein LOCC1_G006219 [Lachnellula occidentalis]|uniref:Uncharacterized protein n=1 Tax=Lachnellula occidentalis TaxID=215460 RepID=A0A8H8S3U9_9HELO|nr:hypothetical protein LOCC1_G006219 [Lachnellula occidentalis]
MATTTYDLGLLHGDTWRQWSDASGLVYYQSLAMPFPFCASLQEFSQRCMDTNNQRTGRARLDNPNPPPATTYLAEPFVAARIAALQKTPNSPEPIYRRMMCGVLQWIFTPTEGYAVMQEDMAKDMHPDFSVFRLLARPGGSAYEYDFLLGETKVPGESWDSFTDHLHTVCAANDNDTKNVYGMLQVGFVVQFFKHENSQFEALSGRMHLVDDVNDFTAWAQYLKAHPMPFV